MENMKQVSYLIMPIMEKHAALMVTQSMLWYSTHTRRQNGIKMALTKMLSPLFIQLHT